MRLGIAGMPNTGKSTLFIARTLIIAVLCGLLLLGLAGCRSSDYYVSQAEEFYWVRDDKEKAFASFDKAIGRDPENDDAYFKRGQIYMHLSEYALALSDFDKAIELDEENIDYYIERGLVYVALEEDELFQANSDKIDELLGPPSTASDFYGLGLRMLQEDNGQALENFNKAIELDPDNQIYYSARGGLYEDMENFELALADYSKAIEIFPFDLTYAQRGALYGKMEEYALAIADYDMAIALDSYPQHPNYFYERGELYQKLGKNDLAQADKEHADALVKTLTGSLDW